MKNVIHCKNCGYENPLFQLICNNCQAFLRDKIYNIDFWDVYFKIVDTPSSTFLKIIQSDHKNFTIPIYIIMVIKLFLFSIHTSTFLFQNDYANSNFILKLTLFAILFSILFFLFNGLLSFFLNKNNIYNRFKDINAISIYSFLPYTIGLVILFVFEIILFGSTLFNSELSPFFFKKDLAYTMLGFESLVILWSFFLYLKAIAVQTGKLMYAFLFSFLFYTLIIFFIYFFAKIIIS